jgi:DNA helicase-2/ATP-dependent DNA helicase PcrA
MTVHSSKGLEYKYVYILGCEENLFPSQRALESPDGVEEERRLFYVALTRAKSEAVLSYCEMRFKWGNMEFSSPSRFLKEIPEDLLLKKGGYQKANTWQSTSYERPYQPAKKVEYYSPKTSSAPVPDYAKGDMVEHTAFGRGLVLSVLKMSGDALLEIAFDRVGTKKLMAKTASAHMKKM